MILMIEYLSKSRLKKYEPKHLNRFEVHWKTVDLDILKFFHQEASVRVQDTIKDHHEISKKYFQLLLLMLSIASALSAFIISQLNSSITDWAAFVICDIGLVIVSFVILIIVQMIRPVNFTSPGREPKNVMRNKWFRSEKFSEDDDLQKILYYQELMSCQRQITINQYYNTKRLDAMDFVIRLLIISFFALSLMLLLIETLN